MAASRTHRYTIDPADLDELIARRATLIAAIRVAHPGLAEARLTRLEDGTFTDVWRWDSAEQLQAGPRGNADPRGPRGDVAHPGRHRRQRRDHRRAVTAQEPRHLTSPPRGDEAKPPAMRPRRIGRPGR
jgi:hypothetical protein